ncbi:substrate-binding domain-containing protein [Variovorax paradoxus]|uniref:substrate-binding domain-containing protein n=1 Tax=Variovorax paradoxus TaxID=34073 RepID=UPI003D64F57F
MSAPRAIRLPLLICGTALQAIGAIDECRRRGIRVPEDLSITGFDDIEHAAIVVPPLTTVKVPTQDIGVLAAVGSWRSWKAKP